MIINKVTITGADDLVNPIDLYNLERNFPFVEWGILFSLKRSGTSRYPSYDHTNKIREFGLRQLSAHFCGWHSAQVLEHGNFNLLNSLTEFKRIQLNYNFSKSSGWNWEAVIKWASKYPEKSIIFQANKSNQSEITHMNAQHLPPNIHFLYDSSGGRGVELTDISMPFNNYTGYSGGLHPDNLLSTIKKINSLPNDENVWIDMESGVRTEDKFDLSKVEDVLFTCDHFVQR